MKKLIFIIPVALMATVLFFSACKHEIDPCEGNPVRLSLTATAAGVGQSNGTIKASASGGSGFQFSINNGTSFTSDSVFTGLTGGRYYVIIVKNSLGCTASDTISVAQTNDPCVGVNVTSTKTDPTSGQSNGSITVVASGASSFQYALNGGTSQSNGNFSGLASGTYTITVTSQAGCVKTVTVTLSCNNPNLVIRDSIVNVLPCPSTLGKIIITASGSSGYTYSKDGTNFQSSNTFSNLAAGNYTVTVKDANGCMNSKAVTVGTQAKGPLFTAVRGLINTYCGSGCHMNGARSAGYNFDNDCSIITYKNQIKGACVQPRTMTTMPPGGLSTSNQQIISNWINAGGRYSD